MTRAAPWQIELDHLPHDPEPWDVAIVGAGPAGSICALHLARRGYRVLVMERHRFPRDKACGDLLIPDSLDALRRAGLYDRVRALGRPLDGATVSSPSRIEWSVEGEFVVLERRRLDALVARGAAEAGAVVSRGTVRAVANEGPGTAPGRVRPGVRLELADGSEVDARVAILATGADVSLLERLGMVRRKEPTAVALRAYLEAPTGPDRLLISFDRSIVPGYGWIFPLPNGRHNVGIGTLYEPEPGKRPSLKALLDRFLESYPPAREMMEAGGRLSDIRGARLRCGLDGSRAVAGDAESGDERILAIGESIGTTYPFTGEGMGKAMESGEIAARTVHEALSTERAERLRAHPHRIESELGPRYGGYQAAQEWLSRPFLNDLLARRARRSPYLQRKAAEMVAETSDPREAVSLRGVVRSLWS